jgi:hypothetical protein
MTTHNASDLCVLSSNPAVSATPRTVRVGSLVRWASRTLNEPVADINDHDDDDDADLVVDTRNTVQGDFQVWVSGYVVDGFHVPTLIYKNNFAREHLWLLASTTLDMAAIRARAPGTRHEMRDRALWRYAVCLRDGSFVPLPNSVIRVFEPSYVRMQRVSSDNCLLLGIAHTPVPHLLPGAFIERAKRMTIQIEKHTPPVDTAVVNTLAMGLVPFRKPLPRVRVPAPVGRTNHFSAQKIPFAPDSTLTCESPSFNHTSTTIAATMSSAVQSTPSFTTTAAAPIDDPMAMFTELTAAASASPVVDTRPPTHAGKKPFVIGKHDKGASAPGVVDTRDESSSSSESDTDTESSDDESVTKPAHPPVVAQPQYAGKRPPPAIVADVETPTPAALPAAPSSSNSNSSSDKNAKTKPAAQANGASSKSKPAPVAAPPKQVVATNSDSESDQSSGEEDDDDDAADNASGSEESDADDTKPTNDPMEVESDVESGSNDDSDENDNEDAETDVDSVEDVKSSGKSQKSGSSSKSGGGGGAKRALPNGKAPPAKRSSSSKPPKKTLAELESDPPARWNLAYVRTLISGKIDEIYRSAFDEYVRGEFESPDVLGLNPQQNQKFQNFLNIALKFYQAAPAVRQYRQFEKLPAPADFFDTKKYPRGLFDKDMPNNIGTAMKDFTSIALVYAPHLLFATPDGKKPACSPTGKFIQDKAGQWVERGPTKRKFENISKTDDAPVATAEEPRKKVKVSADTAVAAPVAKKTKAADEPKSSINNSKKSTKSDKTEDKKDKSRQQQQQDEGKHKSSSSKKSSSDGEKSKEKKDKKERKEKKERKDKKEHKDKKERKEKKSQA